MDEAGPCPICGYDVELHIEYLMEQEDFRQSLDNWRRARGASPKGPDDPPAEEAIRRLRDAW